jgi:hypothetical protein
MPTLVIRFMNSSGNGAIQHPVQKKSHIAIREQINPQMDM